MQGPDGIMGLGRGFVAGAVMALAGARFEAASAAEEGAVTFAAEDGAATVPFESLGGAGQFADFHGLLAALGVA